MTQAPDDGRGTTSAHAARAAPGGSERWPGVFRLKKRPDFKRVQGLGRSIRTRYFVVLYLDGLTAYPRVGLVVTRKVGGAVVRNRIKRALRELVRRQVREWPALDVVIIARPAAAGVPYAVLKADFERPARQIKSERTPEKT